MIKNFFRAARSPYYIYGLDYRYSSAGIRILHYLCHALNEIGEEAYIYCNITNPELRTPQLTQEIQDVHAKSGRKPIAVYPEIIAGNPFHTPIVARYIMNVPGHLGGDISYDKQELLFCCNPYFVPQHMDVTLLYIPASDVAIFNNLDNPFDRDRQGVYFYALKYLLKGGKLVNATKGAIDLVRLAHDNALTPQQLASVLRRAELLYCYEPSGIVVEANLCGCPVAYIPTDYLQDNPIKELFGENGAAFGTAPAAIARAKSTLPWVWNRYHELVDEAWRHLERFVRLTQAAASQLPAAPLTEAISDFPPAAAKAVQPDNRDIDYGAWRESHRGSPAEAARLAAAIAPSLESSAGVHLLMVATAGDSGALADTLDTLAAQGLAHWRLTVFSPDPCPSPLFETVPALAWLPIAAADELAAILARAVAVSPSDWLMVCAPGIRFEPAFVAWVLAAAARRPEWRCLYLDEERLDERGDADDPRLKPDANLELLRGAAYVGQAVLVHRELWPQLDHRLAALPRAFAFDAALRAVEGGGLRALGHIDEIAVALPRSLDDGAGDWAVVAKSLLARHVERSGLTAMIGEGYAPDTFFLDYSLSDHPLVSILIAVAGRLDRARSLIESLLAKTAYANVEILVTARQASEPEALKFLETLPERGSRVRVLHRAKPDSFAAASNAAARCANGEFLLLLDSDTLIVQADWLQRLVALGRQPGVGVVGCRLVSPGEILQNAGLVLGLHGAADGIGAGLSMTSPGYMGRAHLAQDCSAVSASCMLVPKRVFCEIGGLDESDCGDLYGDVDFCLRASERGQRVVWTPFVTLVKGGADLPTERGAEPDMQHRRSQHRFVKKWLHRLGGDPAFNRHLSLRRCDWRIDGDFAVRWHPYFEPLPRIVAHPPDEMGVGQYRMIGPLKELTESGRICSFLLPALTSDKRFLPYISELIRAKPTVFFLQNAFSDFHLDDLQHYAELLPDLFRVFGQDDIVFSVPQKSAARKHFGKDTKARVRKAVSLCHRAIVTTEPIAEAMRGMVDDIRVIPNYLERSRWGDLQAPRNERRKPRVGWAGAQQHQGDLEFILPVVEATANEVDWVFMGMCPPKLRYHVAETHPAVAFDQYPAALAALDLDLAIAPLELNRFNAAKSNLRLLEYGAAGYPVIATDILPYQGAPVTRVPNNRQAWIKAIREHIHELEATRTAGERLRQWVLSGWMLDQHLDEWLRALLPD